MRADTGRIEVMADGRSRVVGLTRRLTAGDAGWRSSPCRRTKRSISEETADGRAAADG
jgi:hypothetical protein